MGGDLVIFWLMGEYHPNRSITENTVAPKFSKPIRMLDSFTKNFSRMALSFEFVFFWQFRIMIETYRMSFGYWWLLQFFTSVCPLKSRLCFYTFSNIFRHLFFINLLFTLYIKYFIYIIYIIYYIIQFVFRGFLTKI